MTKIKIDELKITNNLNKLLAKFRYRLLRSFSRNLNFVAVIDEIDHVI